MIRLGKRVIQGGAVNPLFTFLNSDMRSCCGWMHKKLGGSKRYKCQECGTVMDRDVNGAKNIYLKNCEALGLTCQD